MARSYDEIMEPYRDGDVGVQQVADAAKAHFEAAYEQAFGIGQRIAELRERLHLTQDQVAQRAGIRQSEMSRIERGKANPTQATLAKVAAAADSRLQVRHASGELTHASRVPFEQMRQQRCGVRATGN
jgi:DNA-binding XRE family transcriptional regulator